MGLLAWIILGGLAGWLAGMMMSGGGYGILGNIIIGIVGAVLGGFLASALFRVPDAVNGLNVASLIVAVLGAVILIWIIRALPGRSPV